MTHHDHRVRVGVFDSGLGGLTVLKALLSSHPEYSYVYFGDTAHVPYGGREATEVVRLVSEISIHLVQMGCQALVVACNTSSALALSSIRTVVDVPIIGVIEPAASEASRVTKTGKIAVLATSLTARSGVYAQCLKQAWDKRYELKGRVGEKPTPQLNVLELACPEFVPIAEEGDLQSREARDVVAHYVDQVLAHCADTVILGCTHYPLLLPVLKPLLGPMVTIVDPASLIPDQLQQQILQKPGNTVGQIHFQVSGTPESFDERASRFLGHPVASTQVTPGARSLLGGVG